MCLVALLLSLLLIGCRTGSNHALPLPGNTATIEESPSQPPKHVKMLSDGRLKVGNDHVFTDYHAYFNSGGRCATPDVKASDVHAIAANTVARLRAKGLQPGSVQIRRQLQDTIITSSPTTAMTSSCIPSQRSSVAPTRLPSREPSFKPSTRPTQSTVKPSSKPTWSSTIRPTANPSLKPSIRPTAPSNPPSSRPSMPPTRLPSRKPTIQPTTRKPSIYPTFRPSSIPTTAPSRGPSQPPTIAPSRPSGTPSFVPSRSPSRSPTSRPSSGPSLRPTSRPSRRPSLCPSRVPTRPPSTRPTASPTSKPSLVPSRCPSSLPTKQPTANPSVKPVLVLSPTFRPTVSPADSMIVVAVHFHRIKSSSDLAAVSDVAVDNQMAVLNDAFRSIGYAFDVASSDETVNDAWVNILQGSQEEFDMMSALRRGSAVDLNIYCSQIFDNKLGYASQPWDYAAAPVLDGVVIHFGSLPGGYFTPFNLGNTLVHEVGHWLGLLHTFHGQSCLSDGDLVDDTAQEESWAFGCPVGRDSCPDNPGSDPISNFMDYTDDYCMTEFTAGQQQRVDDMFAAWRLGN